MANSHASKNEIGQIVWAACDTFRGAVDPSEYKNYILTMLFVKYLSDLRKDILATILSVTTGIWSVWSVP